MNYVPSSLSESQHHRQMNLQSGEDVPPIMSSSSIAADILSVGVGSKLSLLSFFSHVFQQAGKCRNTLLAPCPIRHDARRLYLSPLGMLCNIILSHPILSYQLGWSRAEAFCCGRSYGLQFFLDLPTPTNILIVILYVYQTHWCISLKPLAMVDWKGSACNRTRPWDSSGSLFPSKSLILVNGAHHTHLLGSIPKARVHYVFLRQQSEILVQCPILPWRSKIRHLSSVEQDLCPMSSQHSKISSWPPRKS